MTRTREAPSTGKSRRRGPLPNFFIIGAMRSGTTALARYVGAHPDVFMAPEKEVHFFDRHEDRGLDWYRSRFARYQDQRAVGEATQTYLFMPDVPAKIAAVVPDARLIAILRNPVDRAYSHFWMNRGLRTENRDPADALTAEPGAPVFFPYLDRGRYLPQLQRVCEHFSRDALHVLLFEELLSDPEETFAAVCSFLGIDASVRPDNLGRQINKNVAIRSLRVREFARALPAPAAKVIGKLNSKPFSYPKIDPALRRELAKRFTQDNARLAEWLGRDLSIWDR